MGWGMKQLTLGATGFERDWEPSESLNLANIDVNGSYFGSVANGGVFYRDVSPGHYHITPELRPRLQARPVCRPSPGATSVLQIAKLPRQCLRR